MRHPDRGKAISEAVGDCDGETKMYGAGLGGIYQRVVVLASRRKG